ncbi:hypothetical protein Ancab_009912 [Ancistrocladus abbreviatus]
MRGKKIMFVGDSLSLNYWQSLDSGVSVMLFRSLYLVDNEMEDIGRVLKLDSLKSGTMWKDMDVLIFNTRLWWYRARIKKPGADWNESKAKDCSKETMPIRGSTYPTGSPKALSVVKEEISGISKPVYLLDRTTLSQLRKDAHPSCYNAFRGMDCTHWCIVGLLDTWNQLLHAALIM